MRELKKHNFSKVFDLQNSSRTNFYKNILFPKAKKETWSSSITTLPEVIDKKEFGSIYQNRRLQNILVGVHLENTI